MLYAQVTDVNNLLVLAKDSAAIQQKIIEYVMEMRQREMSVDAINMYVSAIMHFYAMNDIILNRKKISIFPRIWYYITKGIVETLKEVFGAQHLRDKAENCYLTSLN